MRILLLLLLGLWQGPSARAQDPFVEIAVECDEVIAGITVADLHDDGRRDLVIATRGGRRLQIWNQTEAGGFEKAGQFDFPNGCAGWGIADLVPPKGPDVVLLDHQGVSAVATSGPKAFQLIPVHRTPLLFPPDHRGAPVWWEWGQDIDGDGVTDLPLPGLQRDLLLLGAEPGKAPRTVPITVRQSQDATGQKDSFISFRRRRPRLAFLPFQKAGQLLPGYQDRAGIHWIDGDCTTGFQSAPRTAFPLKPSEDATALLESSRATLRDWNGDGIVDLAFARTATQAGEMTSLSCELSFVAGGPRNGEDGRMLMLLPGLLSDGPHLEDVDGDGRRDLWLCIGGGSLRSEIAKRLLGRVRLDYHLYLNHGGDRPFARSPELSLPDQVPSEVFADWGKRHRLRLRDDWNGDGRLDLLGLKSRRGELVTTLRFASPAPKPFGFPEGSDLVHRTRFVHRKRLCRRLAGDGRPALILQGERALRIITLRPR